MNVCMLYKIEHTISLEYKAFIYQYILSPNQFGFIKKISTEDAILKLVKYLYDALNSKLNSICKLKEIF